MHSPPRLKTRRSLHWILEDVEEFLSPRLREILAQAAETLRFLAFWQITSAMEEARIEQDCTHELNAVMTESLGLLKKYSEFLPGIVPEEPTTLVLAGQTPHGIVIGGSYLGKFDENHLININYPWDRSPTLSYKKLLHDLQTDPKIRLAYRIGILHELIHQRHAELIGQQEMWFPNLPLDNILTVEDYARSSPVDMVFDLHQKRTNEWNDLTDEEKNWRRIVISFMEGATVSMEIAIAVAESWDKQNDPKTQELYTNYATQRAQMYPAEQVDEWSSLPTFRDNKQYTTGLTMVKRMFETSPRSGRDIMEFYKNIDLRKLYDAHLTKGSPEWKAIMKDPWNELLRIAGRHEETTQSMLEQSV